MKKYILSALLILFSGLSLMAQTQLNSSVFSNGAVRASSGNLALQGSIGQAIVGPTQANSVIANGGFWPTAARTVACGDPVSTLADAGEGSLREALACAVNGDTIRFAVDGTITLTSEITISAGVVIDADGRDLFLDGNGTNRIFVINSSEPVLIRNLTFQNANSGTDFGGAVFIGGPTSFLNCRFIDNLGGNGGALAANSNAYFQNCRFTNNQSVFQAGVIQLAFSVFTFDNCIFDNNQAGSWGGAILSGQSAQLIIRNSTFAGNSAQIGGAIYSSNENITISVANSIISNNTTSQTSGDLFVESGIVDFASNNIIGDPTNSGITIGVDNNISTDPLLRDIPGGDLGLQPFSPAHGNADPSLFLPDILDANNDGDVSSIVNFDFQTTTRGSTDGCNFDIGAVETAQGSLTVINNNDSGVGSLRSHMECAIGNPDINQISFAIPGDGPHTINLLTELPFINTPNLTIDGTSQAGFSFESPSVILDGNDNIPSIFATNGNNTSLLGMGMRNVTNRVLFVGDAEFVTVSGNTIFTNLGQDQIAIFNVSNSNFFNNRIGIDVDGTPSALDRPFFWLDNSNSNRISQNTIAGVGGSISLGLVNGSSDNEVFDNLIGTTVEGVDVGGRVGILIADGANDNQITNNVIANQNIGIEVSEVSAGNLLSPNTFSCNSDLGINTLPGTQQDILPPVIVATSLTTILGTAQPNATIDLYIQDNSQCPDAACQGNFLASISADATGNWNFTIPIENPLDDAIVTAIQTDANNNSSAFATCSLVACDLTAEVVTPVLINCNNPQTTLEASSNGTNVSFAWTGPNNFTSAEQNPTVSEAGVYNLSVTDLAGCEQTAAVVVNGNFVEPNIGVVGAMLDCNNPTTFLSGSSSTPGATFAWTGPNGFSADIPDPEISEPGDYTFTVTAPNGCTSSGDISVTRDETVAPTAGFEITIDDNLGVLVEGNAGSEVSYFYDFGNGQTSTEQNASTSYLSPGLKTIIQIVSNQCGADTTEVQIDLPAPANAVSFCFPEKSEGANGELLDIPVKVTNFNNVASLQLTVKVGDPAIAQLVSVGDFALPDLDENDFNVINDTTVSMAWFFGNGASLPDSSVIFTVQVLLRGTDAVCTPIFMSDTPVFIEVGVLNPNTNSINSAPYEVVAGEVCILPFADISGRIFRETGNGLKEVEVTCTDQMPVITGPDGLYEFLDLQTGLDYFINPSRNTNPVEGVTAIDLALIQRHILTLQFLDSPYKIIAADVDSSLSVGAIDLANIQRLILGRTNVFPNNQQSWRFVDADFQFTNPNDPFFDGIPVGRVVSDLRTDVTDADFVAMKLGDVNGSAQGRQLSTPLELSIVEIEGDDERTVEFRVKEKQPITAYQFDIHFDPGQMQLMDIIPGSLPGININNFGFSKVDEGIIPTLWYDPSGNPAGFELEAGQVLFSLKFRGAQKLPALNQRVWTRESTMPAVAYTGAGLEMPITSFYPTKSVNQTAVLPTHVQVEDLRPNPFTDQTQLRFYLPEAANVDIQISDALGRIVKKMQQQFGAGSHQIGLQGAELGSSGWYIVHLRTGDFVKSQRMVYQR